MVTFTGHIGIHERADGHTDVDHIMAIKPNFLTSMGYHIFLTMVLRARAFGAHGAPLKKCSMDVQWIQFLVCKMYIKANQSFLT